MQVSTSFVRNHLLTSLLLHTVLSLCLCAVPSEINIEIDCAASES